MQPYLFMDAHVSFDAAKRRRISGVEWRMARKQRSMPPRNELGRLNGPNQTAQTDRTDTVRMANGSHLTWTGQFSMKRTVRRPELRQIVPLADTTIYEMEQRGEFPRRFYLTARCVVWDLAEVEAWIEQRRFASDAALIKRAPSPDVRQRKTRPVRQ